jgi:hypothetical protein
LVARFAADLRLRAGDHVPIHAPHDRWYLFDGSTGRTVRFGS